MFHRIDRLLIDAAILTIAALLFASVARSGEPVCGPDGCPSRVQLVTSDHKPMPKADGPSVVLAPAPAFRSHGHLHPVAAALHAARVHLTMMRGQARCGMAAVRVHVAVRTHAPIRHFVAMHRPHGRGRR